MKILVINAGSSSLKYQLIDSITEEALAKGLVDRVGQKVSVIKHNGLGKTYLNDKAVIPTHTEAVKAVLEALLHSEHGVIKSIDEISAVGHRVVHGGEDFTESALIDKAVMKKIVGNTDLAPLHQPANIIGIEACQKVLPKAPHVAVFDTTFHSTIPSHAYMYAIDYDDYKKYRLRRYGFHGTSHMYIAGEVKKMYGKDVKTIICHLGNGASVSAIKDGICYDTSMGLTPLEGLIMGTRSGDIDAAAANYIADKKGMTIQQVTDYLNKKCGVLGISGVSSDFRDLWEARDEGNERAALAILMFAYRVKKYIGSYAAVLGGVDCIVFTGGIGEHNPIAREPILEGLEFLGVEIDQKVNYSAGRDVVTKLSTGKTGVYIIPTNEELVIARETMRLAK
ncbi:MAG: acetate kinase [Firmicutes bacterium]|nr:acetate kinase [Bacillota bacterium]